MARVVIVGDRDSGKTTFLALIYAAQVRSGSDRADDFRFHAAFESLDEISDVFQQLMSRSFPDSAAKEGIREITFNLAFRRSRIGIVSRLRSRGWTASASASLHFILLRNLEDEMVRFRRGSSLTNAALRDVLESDAIAILVDSKKLSVNDEDRRTEPMGKYDGDVEFLLTAMERLRTHGGRRSLHPIFIFSKFDSVAPEALRAAKVDGPPPEVTKTGPRTAYAEALLEHNLPRTFATVRAREARGSNLSKPSYFFTSLRTEEAAPGRRETVRLRHSDGAGWEPDYSKDEYLALLAFLWKIATKAGE